jgi:hypothetical protein
MRALDSRTETAYNTQATSSATGKRGPVAKRRFQKGCFVIEGERMYSMFYEDAEGGSKRVKLFIGKLGEISERPQEGNTPA